MTTQNGAAAGQCPLGTQLVRYAEGWPSWGLAPCGESHGPTHALNMEGGTAMRNVAAVLPFSSLSEKTL
jgi:hypothetical protein